MPDGRLTDLRMRVVTTVYRRVVLMARALVAIDGPSAPADARVALLGEGDIDAYTRFRPDAGASQVERRLERGHRAYLVWVDDRIVHAAWVATGRVPVLYLGRDILLAPDELFVYDSFTHNEFRGTGRARARMERVFADYTHHGYRRCLAIVAAENVVGRLAMESGGYRRAGAYRCLRLGHRHACWPQPLNGQPLPALAPLTPWGNDR